jgi:GT2 family glycosyltransferase
LYTFTIIVPVKSINDYVRESVPHIQRLAEQRWELIIIPNNEEPNEWADDSRISLIPSGRVSPANKRDIGAAHAKGKYLVFLDDDSYPNQDFLKVARKHLQSEQVFALGGPAITPPNSTYFQRVSGAMFLSKYLGGSPERYLPVGETTLVDDWPSVNLIVEKNTFQMVGGFNSKYWPGEDTFFCNELAKRNINILYVPDLKVWHHRRGSLLKHLKQIGAYGLHRGFFAKKFRGNSLKLTYFMPSLLVIYLVSCLFVIFFMIEAFFFLNYFVILYILVLVRGFVDVANKENIAVAIAAIVYAVCSHLTYGICFIVGLTKKDIQSTLR